MSETAPRVSAPVPYSDGLDELRTYLSQSNVPLWQLRQALLPRHSPPAATLVAIAAERFAMPPHAVDLVINADFVPAAVAWNTPTPTTDLVPIDAFLHAASLTYEQLLELLQVAWVQGSTNVAIAGITDSCETDQQTLSPPPDLPWLDRAQPNTGKLVTVGDCGASKEPSLFSDGNA